MIFFSVGGCDVCRQMLVLIAVTIRIHDYLMELLHCRIDLAESAALA